MAIASIRTVTWLADAVIILRDLITDNVTDPGPTKTGNARFCMTSYPKRTVQYPIVTIVDRGVTDWRRGGMASTVSIQTLTIEIRVWGRNVVERDEIAQDIVDELRSRMVTLSSSQAMHNYRFGSMVNVDEPGDQGIKSKILNIEFDAVLGE